MRRLATLWHWICIQNFWRKSKTLVDMKIWKGVVLKYCTTQTSFSVQAQNLYQNWKLTATLTHNRNSVYTYKMRGSSNKRLDPHNNLSWITNLNCEHVKLWQGLAKNHPKIRFSSMLKPFWYFNKLYIKKSIHI